MLYQNCTLSRLLFFLFVFLIAATVHAQIDNLYNPNFRLKELDADAIPTVPKPLTKATNLNTVSYIDPTYNVRVYKATSATDFPGASFVRHEYSRRQAFNADNTRFIAQASNGYWLLYDANTFQVLSRLGTNGALKGMAGDCEPIWHPSDPNKLWFTSINGGMVWYEKNVETDNDIVMADFNGRLPWPGVTSVWTKAEGTSSADGRYFAFMATAYNSTTQSNIIYGLLTYDRVTDQIVGTLDASTFGGAFPDHISMSPSGNYAVPSWAYQPALGTRAYPLDFSSSIQLHTQSEHSDLAIGSNGEDLLVFTDYDNGYIRAVNMADGTSFNIMRLYPTSGVGYSAHISGKAYNRPGWILISAYADFADYGSTQPSPTLYPMMQKIILVELKPNGKQYSVAHTRTAENYGGYFGEPQATISTDGSRILFASNFNDGGAPDSYMIALPSWVYNIVILPLQLITFTASRNNDFNKLEWRTASEITTKEFIVERSTDGSNFIFLATVKAKGAGYNKYFFDDQISLEGKCFYRLKMVDNDGKFSYSPTIAIASVSSSYFTVYPNPVKNNFTLSTSNDRLINTKATLFNINGKAVHAFVIRSSNSTIDMSLFSTGTYLLKFANGASFKIIKE